MTDVNVLLRRAATNKSALWTNLESRKKNLQVLDQLSAQPHAQPSRHQTTIYAQHTAVCHQNI